MGTSNLPGVLGSFRGTALIEDLDREDQTAMSTTHTAGSPATKPQTYDYSDMTCREHWVQSLGALSVGQTVRAAKWSGIWKICRILESDGDVPKMHPYELEAVLETWQIHGDKITVWTMAEALTLVGTD